MSRHHRSIISIMAVAAFFMASVMTVSAETKPAEIKQTDKCAVCGMFVAKYKKWVAEITFRDGSYAVFDGPKDMFKYYFNPPRFDPSRKRSDISGVYVTEYYSAKIMDARQLFFVRGSDVTGPMGNELVPVASEDAALTFVKDHGGTKILKFGEITPETLK